jgi:hypothetical protein
VFVVLNLFTAIVADVSDDGSDAVTALWSLASLVVVIVGSLWLQGALTATVDDVRDGRADDDIEATFRRVRPSLGTLFVAGLLTGLGIALGFIALVIPGLFLLTRWILVTPAVVLERLGATDAMRRSWHLVRGHGWRVFAVILLTMLVSGIAQSVALAVFAFLPEFLQNWIGGVVANSLVAPFVALSWTVMYFRLRGEPEPAAEPVA